MFSITRALPSFRGGNSCPTESHAKPSGEELDQVPSLSTTPLSSSNPVTTPTQNIPPWVREINNSRVTRNSRASSIVSTQTKFTTNTLDARSIDINVGGQYFRISRDGSRVTADLPPPYTGPEEVVRFRGDRASDIASLDGRAGTSEEDDDSDDAEDGSVTPRSTLNMEPNIIDPTEFEMPSPMGYDQLSHRSSSATLVHRTRPSNAEATRSDRLSFEEGREVLSTSGQVTQGRRATSQGFISTSTDSMPLSSPLRRTHGVRLPRLITSSDIPRATHRPQRVHDGLNSSPGRPLQTRSAGAILGSVPANREPRSPDYIGRNARGTFPFPIRAATTQNGLSTRNRDPSVNEAGAIEEDEATEENNTPLAMNDENDISLHYARMMRKLDQAHRNAVHIKDKQVGELREKLNEKDIVLRQQLRAKDFIIDDLKQRLDALEENVEIMLEKARHQVEDLWEARWKDRDFHLRERMRRIEEDAQKAIHRFRGGPTLSTEGLQSPAG